MVHVYLTDCNNLSIIDIIDISSMFSIIIASQELENYKRSLEVKSIQKDARSYVRID